MIKPFGLELGQMVLKGVTWIHNTKIHGFQCKFSCCPLEG